MPIISQKGIPLGSLLQGISKLYHLYDVQSNLDTLNSTDFLLNTLWFRIASSHNATDPRDIVYGILSLLPKSLVAVLPVEYSETNTFQRVMVDFAAAQVASRRSLYWILMRPWSPFAGHERWPSWVPNLGLPFSSAHYNWVMGGDGRRVYDACRGLEEEKAEFDAHVQISAQDGLLTCRAAFALDTVCQTSGSMVVGAKERAASFLAQPWLVDEVAEKVGVQGFDMRRNLRSLFTHVFPDPPPLVSDEPPPMLEPRQEKHQYSDLEGLKQALADCFRSLRVTPQDPSNSSSSIFDTPLDAVAHPADNLWDMDHTSPTFDLPIMTLLRMFVKTCKTIDLWGLGLHDLFAGSPLDKSQAPAELAMHDRTLVLGQLFTTWTGFVGTALCNARPGDRVFLLVGCPMPVILRPSTKRPQTWEMVGGVYISGLMDGEAAGVLAGRMQNRRR
ncbi:hypothetical protein B0T25DRAFT_528865 [Lasiosphaeria hispida]|uniref:Heterokaryon incompatibility domain-containing protein n=1 Tax=Lasiosphaeria hispida TaxID=260671 RepID=A0AAJ0HWI5_9PEZI|nr:hypothetical protein B0T25DRAFT_528865 [Lasiosphaeria hispida]